MPDGSVGKDNLKSTQCRWWQRHQWGKWEEVTVKVQINLRGEIRTIEHCMKRTCLRCGTIDFQKISQY